MKKIIVAALVLAMSFTLFGCSKNNDGGKNGKETEIEEEETKSTAEAETEKPVGNVASIDVSSTAGTYTFKFNSALPVQENAWLGLVPVGNYTTELEADEVDFFWVGPDSFSGRSANDPYVFVISGEDIASFEEGDYTMVLCDNDDEGKVLLQFPVTVRGIELIADLDKVEVK